MTTIIRDGTSQDQRMLPALRAGYVRPDETGLPELIYLGSRHARLLAYVAPDNRIHGDWQPLFGTDPAAVLADIIVQTAHTEALRDEFRAYRERLQAMAMDIGACPPPQAVPPYRVAAQLLDWRDACKRLASPAAERLCPLIAGLLAETVAPALGDFAATQAPYDDGHGAALMTRLDPAWRGTDAQSDADPVMRLDHVFLALTNALTVMRQHAVEMFPTTLAGARHDPAFGLYAAFASLYLKAKSRIDDFSQRHLRFYYDRILGFRPQPAQPDSAYLVLTADGTRAESLIAKGTPFIAAEDAAGNEARYAATEDISVTDARVAALRNLYLERDPHRAPENRLGHVTFARVGEIPLPADQRHYPLFGALRANDQRAYGTHARLGFALASPLLWLREGVREIDLRLHFLPRGDNLEHLVDRLCGSASGASREGAFFRAFAHAWRIQLTVADGWRPAPELIPGCHFIDAQIAPNCLALRLRLPEDFPAVTGYRQDIHGDAYDTGHPVAACTIDPDSYLYPYDFFASLALQEVEIAVTARGCRDLRLYNQHGELSAATPFMPFGPQPQAGASYFVVGSREAATKPLSDLKIHVKWDGLPADGLESHYRAYAADIDAASFRANLSVLRDRAWLPAADAPVALALCSAVDAEGQASYDCRRLLPFARPVADDGDFAYGPQTKGGFFRLTLAEPEIGFGQGVYPLLLTEVLTYNARLEALGPLRRLLGRKTPRPLPLPPYTPTWSAIAIDYAAQSRISLRRGGTEQAGERLYHIHPFAVEPLRAASGGDVGIVPVVDADANLYVGLAATAPGGPLSLYFHLRNDSAADPAGTVPEFTWHARRAERWEALEGYRVLADTTHGFLASGIVKLDLPRDLAPDDAGLYWLRLAARGAVADLCSVYTVSSHGLRVERCPDQDAAAAVLPAGSIRAAQGSLPGIAAILQPANSFGGQAPESLAALTTRASERLKHKQRAVTAWDYERLVLERFPHLHKVKCFANTRIDADPARWHHPGELLIVVVPRLDDNADWSERLRANVLTLREIKSYLSTLASPFARIDVRNPVFEQIQVRCAATFRGNGAQGLLIKRLNRDICAFISPWGKAGNTANFGWSLRCQEIQGYLEGLPYVAAVWGLSLLRVVENGGDGFLLHDTAGHGHAATALGPRYPWGIAIPLRHHLIETASPPGADPEGPWASGIARLQVGSTFIVSRH